MADHNGHREPATPEEIRNILREVAESPKETDRRMQETRRLLQQWQETDRRMRETDDLFNGPWERLVESLADRDLVNLLSRRGIAVDHTMTSAKKDYGEHRWEFDVLAVNRDEVVVVEVKTTLKAADVDDFVERLHEFPELMREYAARRVYGAVAYLEAHESATAHAARQGLFVIRATGSSAGITNAGDFTPRTFGRRGRSDNRWRLYGSA